MGCGPSSSADASPPTARAYCSTVIFLDVDGVLHRESGNTSGNTFETECMKNLAAIVNGSRAAICLSSSWRCTSEGIASVNTRLQDYGILPVADCTPMSGYATRIDEILAWLDDHREANHFVALDDMDLLRSHRDTALLAPHFVRTSKDTGLAEHNVAEALEALERRRPLDLPKPSRHPSHAAEARGLGLGYDLARRL